MRLFLFTGQSSGPASLLLQGAAAARELPGLARAGLCLKRRRP